MIRTAKVTLSGCDDETTFTFPVTDAALEVLQQLAATSVEASEYGCQPIMTVALNQEDTE